MNSFHSRLRGGFSLIEVLIAVVILSVGLLALAALQINVVRSTADAKARSTALSLAQEKLEQAREFTSRGSDPAADCPAATWPGRYSCVAPPAAAETMTVGGTAFNRNWTVDRYVFNEDTGNFAAAAVGTADTALATGLRAGTEFKRIEVTVGWTDAEGDVRSVTVTDSVSASSPSESSRARAFQRPGVRTPEVLIYDPSNTPGVIPIAIGNGTDTAATNPRPEVAGRNNDPDVVETRFDVLTYAGLNNNTAQVQARVETVVVGCTCVDAPGSGIAYRPTYWSGTRYAKPEPTGSTPPARHKSLGNNDGAESRYCTECCRDHHDAGFSGPKFSPRRANHLHDINGGEYREACRLIRVDGIFRVASDPYADYYNLLGTANSSNDWIPDPTASTNYQNLVLDYLDDRVVTPGSGYNTPLGSVAVTALESAHSINDPGTVNIEAHADTKWLHARGLYVDYLEQDAIDAINEAKSNCGGDPTACVLPYVPFTSINLTEIANWLPDQGDFLVSNGNFRNSPDEPDPVRGEVSTVNASAGSNHTATSSMFNTSAGLALLRNPINADDVVVNDAQSFHVTGGGTPPVGTSGVFTVNVSGYPFSISTVSPTFTGPGIPAGCSITNPFSCSSGSLGLAFDLIMGDYNESRPEQVSNQSVTCTKNNGSDPLICQVSYSGQRCVNYEVQSASVNGAPTPEADITASNDGLQTETTTMSFSLLDPDDVVSIQMVVTGSTLSGINSCTYNGSCNKTNLDLATCP